MGIRTFQVSGGCESDIAGTALPQARSDVPLSPGAANRSQPELRLRRGRRDPWAAWITGSRKISKMRTGDLRTAPGQITSGSGGRAPSRPRPTPVMCAAHGNPPGSLLRMTTGNTSQSLGDRALALQAAGQHEKAVELVRLHLRIRPRDSTAISIMGLLLRRAGELNQSAGCAGRSRLMRTTLRPSTASG